MNIIISSLSEIKKTGTGADLDSAKLFIAKSIENSASLLMNIQLIGNGIYPLIATQKDSLEKNDFYGYQLNSRVFVPNGEYIFKIGNLEIESFIIQGDKTLIDEHEPIYIIGRQINPIAAQIVAEDANSQQFTFYIKNKYDGVSFIDESKAIYADYIPVNKEDLPLNTNFLSDRLAVVYEDIMPPYGQESEWILLKWSLPYLATKTAGVVNFQISVINAFGDSREYTWQTLPSSFKVSKNLAPRGDTVLTPEETSILADLIDDVNEIKEDVNALEVFVGNQADDDLGNDFEILISGGSAPSEE